MKPTIKKNYQIAILLSLIASFLTATGAFAAASAGVLDDTFDGDGLVSTAFPNPNGPIYDLAYDIAIQPDGKLVVIGAVNHNFGVARYNTDGSLDTSFDTDGLVTTEVDQGDLPRSVAIQEDGKIVVAGGVTPDEADYRFALVRYNSDGSLDSTFGTGGIATKNFGDSYDLASDVVIQPDGKIIIAGSTSIAINDDDIALLRYNANGTLDTTFDQDGIVTLSLGDEGDHSGSVALQADGKIIVGASGYINGNRDLALIRYNNDGSLDSSFGINGIVTTDFNSEGEGGGFVAIQPNGNILIAGVYHTFFLGYFGLARYHSDGSLDTSFGTDGKVSTEIGDTYASTQDIALQPNGKIILAGNNNADDNFVLVRYNNDGSLDSSFDTDGITSTDFGDTDSSSSAMASAVVIQPDGNIVEAGSRYIASTTSHEFALARFVGDSVITVTTNNDDTINDTFCSLREAITNANDNAATFADCSAGSGVDRIAFSDALGAATITLAADLPSISDTAGLTINGGGDIVINGATSNRVFYVNANASLTITTLTITQGSSSTNGGGAYNDNGTLTIVDCTFSNNAASNNGGGIYNVGGTLNIINSVFSGNSAGNGAGIYNLSGIVNITNSAFSDNVAANNGGGIYNENGTVSIANSTISTNSAVGGYGGGLIATNAASSSSLINNTFSGNIALSGSGIYFWQGSMNLYNTIVANSADGLDCTKDIAVGTLIAFNNLIEDNTNNCGLVNNTNGNIIGSDPNLGALTGFPNYFPLNNDSLAINAGDDTICASTPINNLDQRGMIRPYGAHCDIGSYEVNDSTAPTVSSIIRISANPTNHAIVNFEVTFSEPVMGVSTADFSPTTTIGMSGASVSGVSGSGATRIVTVNTGSGDGTIGLDIPTSATVTDIFGNPLGGLPYIGQASYTVNKTLTFTSTAEQDGWLLESNETSNLGGMLNNTATTLRVGDDASKKQYRGILSFNTASIPDTAVITAVTLKVKKQGVTGGGNPLTTFQGFMVDIKKGLFGAANLQTADFQTAPSKTYGPFSPSLASNWYSINLTTGKAYINKLSNSGGLTQIRLRFKLDDNNNAIANYLSLYSGNAPAGSRPQLVITYIIP